MNVQKLFSNLGITCTQKQIKINANTNKKSVYPINTNSNFDQLRHTNSDTNKTGFEATRAPNTIFLDIDAKSKTNQQVVLRQLVNFFESDACKFKSNAYIEKSVNGGLHIILKISKNITKISECGVSDIVYGDVVVEFKERMLVFPTDGMQIIFKPIINDLACVSFEGIVDMITEINNVIGNDESSLELDIDHASSSIRLNTVQKFDKQMMIAFNKILHQKNSSNDKDVDDGDDGDDGDEKEDEDDDEEDQEEQDNELLINNSCNVRKRAFDETDNDIIDSGGSGSGFSSNDSRRRNNDLQPNNNNKKQKNQKSVDNDYFTNLLLENRAHLSEEIERDTVAEIEGLAGSTNGESRVDSRIEFVAESILTIASWFAKNINNVYYTDFTVLLMMLSSTSQDDNCRYSLFTKLRSFIPWRQWSLSYIKLMKTLERVRQGPGKCLYEKYDSYHFYRFITKQNEVGFAMSENAAKSEYNQLYNETRRTGCTPHLIFLIYDFIIQCFKYMKYDTKLIDSILTYTTNICDTNPNRFEMCKFDLLRVRMCGLDFQTAFITEGGGGRGETRKLMCVNIRRCPWTKINSQSFLKFLRRVYPSVEDINKFIDKLNFTGYKCIDDGIRSWKCMLPFINGVLEFKTQFKFRENISTISTRRQDDMLEEIVTVDSTEYTGEKVIFRNYNINDKVLEPLGYKFSPLLYNTEYEEHGILSLENTRRYTKQFCWFIKGTFGVHEKGEGVMYSWHLQRMFACMTIVAASILRTKPFQKCIVLNGVGSNGKSEFINQLLSLFGDKCKPIDAKVYFSPTDINQQGM